MERRNTQYQTALLSFGAVGGMGGGVHAVADGIRQSVYDKITR